MPGSDIVLESVMMNPLRTGLFLTLREMGASIETLSSHHDGGEEDCRPAGESFRPYVASRCLHRGRRR